MSDIKDKSGTTDGSIAIPQAPSIPNGKISRRSLIQVGTAIGAGITFFPRFSLANSPNSKLNIAMIGAGGIADMAYDGTCKENIVALADVDSTKFRQHVKKYPQLEKAKTFSDFRVMFDKMGSEIDAVCINTPDHTHFVATMEAMQRGKHVCTQKPLTHTIWESRTLQLASKKYKLVTCMANQGHTYNGIRSLREWYEAGVIGQVKEAHSWRLGPEWDKGGPYFSMPKNFPLRIDPVPSHLDYDLWLGPIEKVPYSSFYHPLKWRGFHRFGGGMFGDWMPHVADAPVWILDLYDPKVIELVQKDGGNEVMVPDGNSVRWDFGARGVYQGEGKGGDNPLKSPISYYWHNGPQPKYCPNKPKDWDWSSNLPEGGSLLMGDKNTVFADERSNNPRLVNKEAMKAFQKSGFPAQKYPRVPNGGPHAEWVRAIKGDGPEPGSNFAYATRFNEMMILGIMAAMYGGRIEWDANNMRITNRPELNVYLRTTPRKGWEYGEDLWKV